MKRARYFRCIPCILLLALLLTIMAGCKVEGTSPTAPVSTAGTTSSTGSHSVSVMFINVGRADAALVQIDGYSCLIDTGEKSSVPMLLGALALRGVQKLDAVFLTHTHSDHIGGMETLMKKYAVGTLYSAEISMDKKNGENAIDTLAAQLALNHKKLKAGDTVALTSGVTFDVLGPLQYNGDDDNDNSLVLRLKVNTKTFLFAGDMQFKEEATLLNTGVGLSADVLKVGNHGNPDATSEQFAQAVSPQIAIISTNTSVDTDSANERVKSALKGARILITQDYTSGILLVVGADGSIAITNPSANSVLANVKILSLDKSAQTITLINIGNRADISGYFLFSERGSEVFVFPKGTVIEAGQKLTVACKGGQGELIWDDKNVWSAKKEDVGVLFDAYGRELSRMP